MDDAEVQSNQKKRRGVDGLILFIILAPFAVALLSFLFVIVGWLFR